MINILQEGISYILSNGYKELVLSAQISASSIPLSGSLMAPNMEEKCSSNAQKIDPNRDEGSIHEKFPSYCAY